MLNRLTKKRLFFLKYITPDKLKINIYIYIYIYIICYKCVWHDGGNALLGGEQGLPMAMSVISSGDHLLLHFFFNSHIYRFFLLFI